MKSESPLSMRRGLKMVNFKTRKGNVRSAAYLNRRVAKLIREPDASKGASSTKLKDCRIKKGLIRHRPVLKSHDIAVGKLLNRFQLDELPDAFREQEGGSSKQGQADDGGGVFHSSVSKSGPICVPPFCFVVDAAYSIAANTVLLGDARKTWTASNSEGQQGTYFGNTIFAEFSFRMAGANAHSALSDHVQCVQFWFSHEEMVWPNAWRVIAVMEYLVAFWDSTMREHPSNSVRPVCFIVVAGVKLAVAFWAKDTSPCPASIALSNLRPESFSHWPLFVCSTS